MKVQIGYGEEHGLPPAPRVESNSDNRTIILAPTGMISERVNRECTIQLTFDRKNKIWRVRIPESGVKIIPEVANGFGIELTGMHG